jgi:Zn-dependent M16 (insulinase) family peptidase
VALSFLDYLLTGTSAAPLTKAMNDSGLGESIVGGGVEDTLRQPVYTMGLKGVKPEDVEKVCLAARQCVLASAFLPSMLIMCMLALPR